MSDETTTEPRPTPTAPFTVEQAARAEGLRVARTVLARKVGGAFSPATNLENNDTAVTDLVDLAQYIVAGTHPLDRFGNVGYATGGEVIAPSVAAGTHFNHVHWAKTTDPATDPAAPTTEVEDDA